MLGGSCVALLRSFGVQVGSQTHMAYMARVHSALGVSPFEMPHGYSPRLAVLLIDRR
jgi:hypothetical protein